MFLVTVGAGVPTNGDGLFEADFAYVATSLTATATDPNGNTSQFSNAIGVIPLSSRRRGPVLFPETDRGACPRSSFARPDPGHAGGRPGRLSRAAGSCR